MSAPAFQKMAFIVKRENEICDEKGPVSGKAAGGKSWDPGMNGRERGAEGRSRERRDGKA